eukprot:gene26853-35217_t
MITTLCSEASPVERSGAAQGLAEVCRAIGHDRAEETLFKVLQFKKHPSSAAREGLLWFMSFLPAILNESFSPYIAVSLPVIVAGLSDDNDGVALRAGQVIVLKLGIQHANEIVPTLTNGMFDADWRIRQSSVKLLGELLYLVGDTKAVGLADENDEGDNVTGAGGVARVSAAIRSHIGDASTDQVLACLYIARSDVAIAVRQNALQIWKAIVTNTPRTLVEIMKVLLTLLIEKLSDGGEDDIE